MELQFCINSWTGNSYWIFWLASYASFLWHYFKRISNCNRVDPCLDVQKGKFNKKQHKNWNFYLPLFHWNVVCHNISFISYGFGAWVNQEIIYGKKENPNETINRQLWDIGAFGYGGQRTVKLSPFLKFWNWAEPVDASKIDKKKWILIQKNGKAIFP